MARLVLDRTGMQSPLDVGATAPTSPPPAATEPAVDAPSPAEEPSTAEPSGSDAGRAAEAPTGTKPAAPRAPRKRRAPARETTGEAEVSDAPAPVASRGAGEASGYSFQTAIAFDVELYELVERLADGGGVAVRALVIAALDASLPPDSAAAGQLALRERFEHIASRIERNIRLPQEQRERLDELVAPHERTIRGARSMLINALLRNALPNSAAGVSQLVQNYQLQRALAALGNTPTS